MASYGVRSPLCRISRPGYWHSNCILYLSQLPGDHTVYRNSSAEYVHDEILPHSEFCIIRRTSLYSVSCHIDNAIDLSKF